VIQERHGVFGNCWRNYITGASVLLSLSQDRFRLRKQLLGHALEKC